MATLALQDPDEAVRELERCVTKLGFKGVMVNGYTQVESPDNLVYLDDARMTPLWEALTALDVPLSTSTHARRTMLPCTTTIRSYRRELGFCSGDRDACAAHRLWRHLRFAFRLPSWCWDISASRYRMERRITSCERQTRRKAMTKDLGVWTYENSALVLIDYQKEMFETIRSETSAELADLNVRLLAMTAKAFNMPVVLSTVGVKYGINGPTHASILAELPGVEPIDRTSMNAFEDPAFSNAVKSTSRKRLIFGGLHTEICLTFAVLQALKDGYEGMFVTDAVGGRSQSAHRIAIERMAHAGAVPNTALAVVTELFRDWASPLADKARNVIYWYFGEVGKLNAGIGVSEVEKQAAKARERA
jgi:nicotinamidase-related amidase